MTDMRRTLILEARVRERERGMERKKESESNGAFPVQLLWKSVVI